MNSFEKNKFGHWSPRYLWDRGLVLLDQSLNTGSPWLTNQAVFIIRNWLSQCDHGLEFGSGRSTLWFARRAAKLTSVEHDQSWYERISKELENAKIENVDYLFRPVDESCEVVKGGEYSRVASQFSNQSLDFVLVDGAVRSACALASLEKIKPGGILIVDNVNWALPSRSRSPASRSKAQGPVSEEWKTFLERVNDWRRIWTSNGVTDTAIYFRSCPPES